MQATFNGEITVDITTAQSRVNELVAAMVAKGMVAPEVSAIIRSERQPTVYLQWKDNSKEFGTAYDCFYADNLN